MKNQFVKLNITNENIQLTNMVSGQNLTLTHSEIRTYILEKSRAFAQKKNLKNKLYFIMCCTKIYDMQVEHGYRVSEKDFYEFFISVITRIDIHLEKSYNFFCSDTSDTELLQIRAVHAEIFESEYGIFEEILTKTDLKTNAGSTQKKIDNFFK